MPEILDFDGLAFAIKHLPLARTVKNNRIIMLVKVPLNDHYESYTIYRTFDIPIIHQNTSIPPVSTTMAAKYNLEADGLAINKINTKYILLNDKEIEYCSQTSFCHIPKPMYSVELHLFLDNKSKIQTSCNKLVTTNAQLPSVVYITKGIWALTSVQPLRLSIKCKEIHALETSSIVIKIPFDIVKLRTACSADNEYIYLPASYDDRLTIYITDDLLTAVKISLNISSVNMWKDFTTRIKKNYNHTLFPQKLRELEYLPTSSLIEEIMHTNTDERPVRHWSVYTALI